MKIVKKVDLNIVKDMEKLGFDKELVLQCIDANKHNNVSTTYDEIWIVKLFIYF